MLIHAPPQVRRLRKGCIGGSKPAISRVLHALQRLRLRRIGSGKKSLKLLDAFGVFQERRELVTGQVQPIGSRSHGQ